MKKNILIPTILIIVFVHLGAAEYIIPPEYDNMVLSTKSKVSVLISNDNTLVSSNTYNIQGRTAKYKCAAVPKINCRGGSSPYIIPTLKKMPVLKDSVQNEQITGYQVDVQVDADVHGNDFWICGAAVGAITWDSSSFASSATGYTYTYIPENKQVRYFFFTDLTGNADTEDGIGGGNIVGSADSYMVIDAEQVCR